MHSRNALENEMTNVESKNSPEARIASSETLEVHFLPLKNSPAIMKMEFHCLILSVLHMMHGKFMLPPSSRHNSLPVLRVLSRAAARRECWIHETEIKRGMEVFLYLHSLGIVRKKSTRCCLLRDINFLGLLILS